MSDAFDKFARPVQKWIRQQGWPALRDIQVDATHRILDTDSDLIVAASTAGGKTEAAFLPLISQVIDTPSPQGGFDVLYIVPLKALITDQADRLKDICLDADLPVVPWHGDVSASVKSRALKQPRGILLITPESLEALFVRRGLEIGRLFGATRAIVLDELHSMLDSERGVQMRALLTRLEIAVARAVRRIGLSATLGDMRLACDYLRPDAPDTVGLIKADSARSELQLQVRGYISGDQDATTPSPTDAISKHMFKHLRGSNNLIFAGARQSVEIYADRLRASCEAAHLPQEFYPHHASLSRDHRDFVEKRLKDPRKPTSAVCTSTLELGIDIGDVTCVAQIGAPFSVAALRQRMGRSGRRAGQPAVLRQYAVEARLEANSSFVDRLRLGLIRSIAMIDLLLEEWCEPPKPQALHLSTLVHQILSIVAERGGAHANRLYRILCLVGPFRTVDQQAFGAVLRSMGSGEMALIEQSRDGLLLLGAKGEKLVEHYSFYAVFQTPEEYRLIAQGRELGTLPVDSMVAVGMMLIFSGRRWAVNEIHENERVIVVSPATAGVPPKFGGGLGDVHDRVIERMFTILESNMHFSYLDKTARSLLEQARGNFAHLKFGEVSIAQQAKDTCILATRSGTVKTTTLALALRSFDFSVEQHDGFLEVGQAKAEASLREVLLRIAKGAPVDLFAQSPNLMFEKYHPYLSKELLQKDALSQRLDQSALPDICQQVLDIPHRDIA